VPWLGPKDYPYADNLYNNRFYNVTFLAKTRGNASRIALHFCFRGFGDISERGILGYKKWSSLEWRVDVPQLWLAQLSDGSLAQSPSAKGDPFEADSHGSRAAGVWVCRSERLNVNSSLL
jgi:hypothetical protein